MLFVCYPKCTTCQKAQKWLESRGAAFEARDIKLENPNESELSTWIKKSGLPVKRFFNTSGLKYKELGLKDKIAGMGLDECIKLLATDGMLVKRPLLVGEDFAFAGFKESEWSQKL